MAFKKIHFRQQHYDSPESMFHDLRHRKVEGLLSHQADILKEYMKNFDSSDIAIELPTGSGKTLVGLLIAEYRRINEDERALYLCPTRQLVNQVVGQAVENGIKAISFTGSSGEYGNENKTDYLSSKAIAVTTYSSLFNINPFFENPQIIILDDSHASENYIGSTWSMEIVHGEHEDLYKGIISVFEDFFNSNLNGNQFKNESSDSNWAEKIPNPDWVEKIPTEVVLDKLTDLKNVIEKNIGNTKLKYPWHFLRDKLYACQIYLSYHSILIRPYIPPSLKHPPFADAKQRIYMSATLGAGGDLERITGVPEIKRIPIPDGWDQQGIGRRYFLFPKLALPEKHDQDFIIELITQVTRALILVPNNSEAERITTLINNKLGWTTVSASEIEKFKSSFTGKDNAVAVLANRYDGIDMAGEECRLLFVIGLPKAINLQEKFMLSRMACSLILNDRIRTRIVQAIGRCTRNQRDYAAVVMMGDDFQDWFLLKEKPKLFHPELQAEITFGIEQSREVSTDTLIENLKIFLKHDEEWKTADQDILSQRNNINKESIPEEQQLFKAASKEVKFMYALWDKDFKKAFELAEKVTSIYSGGKNIRGVRSLWNYFAGSSALLAAQFFKEEHYKNKAKTFFKRAAAGASSVTWLRKLASTESIMENSSKDNFDLLLECNIERLDNLFETRKYSNLKKFESDIKTVLDGINQNEYKPFENSHKLLGDLLGFNSNNPKDDGAPDVYWIVDDYLCIVFEDKTNTSKETPISKRYTTQVSQHPEWIKHNVKLKQNALIIPVIVTPQTKISKPAAIHAGKTRYWNIDNFRKWAGKVMKTLKKLRLEYPGNGDMVWREKAIELFREEKFSPKGIIETLDKHYLKDLEQ